MKDPKAATRSLEIAIEFRDGRDQHSMAGILHPKSQRRLMRYYALLWRKFSA